MKPWLLLALLALACDDGGSSEQPATDAGVATDALGPDAGDAPDGAQPDADGPGADAADPDAALPDAGEPDAAPPPGPVTAPGPYPVGYRVDSTTYQVPGLDRERTLRVVYWYPAAAAEGATPRYGSLVPRPTIFTDAPLARAAQFPVLLFSHGNSGFAEQSFDITEFFASHGWVVVALDHTGNTFNNMRLDTAELFEIRPKDVTAVLDHIYALEDSDPLAGRLTEQVVMTGHSFGGYTSIAVAGSAYNLAGVRAECEAAGDCTAWDAAEPRYAEGFGDDRVIAAAPLTPAGAFVFGPGLTEVDIPMMLVTAGRDATLPNAREGDPIWAGLARGDNLRLDFPDAGHFSFASFCDVFPSIGENDGCGDDFTAPAEVFAATNAYLLAFARLHLLGDDTDADLLDGTRALTDIVDISLPEDP